MKKVGEGEKRATEQTYRFCLHQTRLERGTRLYSVSTSMAANRSECIGQLRYRVIEASTSPRCHAGDKEASVFFFRAKGHREIAVTKCSTALPLQCGHMQLERHALPLPHNLHTKKRHRCVGMKCNRALPISNLSFVLFVCVLESCHSRCLALHPT